MPRFAIPTSPTSGGLGSSRIVFVDQTRSLAIMLMLVGHSLHRFLGEPWRSGDAYQNYQFVRGISSTLFLTISGFSFVIASFSRFDEYTRFSPRLAGRARRFALILFLGTVLNLWGPTLSQSIATFNSSNLEKFLRFDVLQNIAFSLALLHALIWITKSPDKFGKVIFPAAGVVFALGFLTYRLDIDALLPAPIAAMVNMYHRSRFPVIPYTGYLLLGAGLGFWFWKRQKHGDPHRVFNVALLAGVLLIGLEFLVIRRLDGGVFPYSAGLKNLPGNTFARAGCALFIIAGLYYLGRVRLILPRLAFVLSKDTLLIYFVHLLIVYGANSLPKFMGLKPNSMSPWQVGTFILCLAISMGALAAASGWLRSRKLEVHRGIRRFAILSGVLTFAFCAELSVPMLAGAITVALFLTLMFQWMKIRAVRSPAKGKA